MNQSLEWVERVLTLSTDEINWVVLSRIDEHGRKTGFSRERLAADVVEHFRDAPLDEGPDTLYEAESLLHHKHLPRLAEFGLVAYDGDSETVTAGPDLDRGLRTLGHTMEMAVELSGNAGENQDHGLEDARLTTVSVVDYPSSAASSARRSREWGNP